ncbi:hypothetical protein BZI29_003385 [Salmonella enterica subsp. enterica serovar Berta]|nr:hypothetical protein [Salmonella enterica subsp. enterica serovar Berta]
MGNIILMAEKAKGAIDAEQRGIAALLYNVLFKYHLMILKVDFLRRGIYTVFIG